MATKTENDAPSRSTISAHTGSGLRSGFGHPDTRKQSNASIRGSTQLQGGKTSATKLENNYKMAPEVRFNSSRVKAILQQTLETRLESVEYCPETVKTITRDLCDVIKHQVKLLGFSRHKLVSNVIIGPTTGQGVRVASRCVWDEKHDDYASVSYQNESMFVVASVYGVYFE
nr:dynein light chain Tctex-type protein 2B-like [Lytechinus pictus]